MKLNEDLVKDLKSSHFDFGGYNKKPCYSQYAHQFRSVDQPDFSNRVPIDVKSFKQSHLKFGDYNSDNFYTSAKSAHFQHPGRQEIAKINEEKLQDLRSHHFKLGGWAAMHDTTVLDMRICNLCFKMHLRRPKWSIGRPFLSCTVWFGNSTLYH